MRTCVQTISGFFLALVLSACGGGGGSAPASSVLQGTFVDSPVLGLEFSTATQSGITDSQGAFQYKQGEVVTFAIGGIVLGQAPASPTMTPIDLVPGASDAFNPTVINICRVLQTMDDDGDPENGITIPAAVRTAAHFSTLDFNSSAVTFGTDEQIGELMTTLTANTSAGERPLVTTEQALLHFLNYSEGSTCTDNDGDGYTLEGGACNATETFVMFNTVGQAMIRWWASNGYNPGLLVNDFMNDFYSYMSEMYYADTWPRSLMTQEEMMLFQHMLYLLPLHDHLTHYFPMPISEGAALISQPALFFAEMTTGERQEIFEAIRAADCNDDDAAINSGTSQCAGEDMGNVYNSEHGIWSMVDGARIAREHQDP